MTDDNIGRLFTRKEDRDDMIRGTDEKCKKWEIELDKEIKTCLLEDNHIMELVKNIIEAKNEKINLQEKTINEIFELIR